MDTFLLLLSCAGVVCFIFKKKLRKFLSRRSTAEQKELPSTVLASPDLPGNGSLCVDFMCFNPEDFPSTQSMSDAVSVALNKKLLELHNRNIVPSVDFAATGFVVAFTVTYRV